MSVKQVKEPGQVQPDIVMGPGVRPQQGGKAKKEANIGMPASGKTPIREGAEIWNHWPDSEMKSPGPLG